MKDFEHLQWLHDRIVNQYGEDPSVDFLIKLREIIKERKEADEQFEKYLQFLAII